MKAFHLVGPAPFYTNSFLLISDAGNAVVIDPAAEVQEYDKICKGARRQAEPYPLHPRPLRPCGQCGGPEPRVGRKALL